MFEVIDHARRLAAHVFNGILVTEPVRALDRVIKVKVPVVLAHVAQRRANTALRGHGVRAGRKHFGQYRDIQPGTGQLQRGPHAGAAGSNNDNIEFTRGDFDGRNGHVIGKKTIVYAQNRALP